MLWNIDLPRASDRRSANGSQGSDKRDAPSSTAGKIVLKLSSTRITSAASFATSVPLLPIDTPMSAIFSAGASFTVRQNRKTINKNHTKVEIVLKKILNPHRPSQLQWHPAPEKPRR
jgi:hypothetical protein